MNNLINVKKDIVQVGKDLYDKGLLVGTDGNISVKVDENKILITASGFCKGKLNEEQITLVTLDGEILSGLKPARDIRMHLAAYKQKPNTGAVVHAHPPFTTGFSMSEIDMSKVSLPEVLFNLNGIAVTEYTTPTTIEVPREVTRVLKEKPESQAIILTCHGALTLGSNVFDAFYKMETLEMFCKATLVSRIFGNTRHLNEEQLLNIKRLMNGEKPDDVIKP
ncbi:MAG TPA: class II aldolase/adducin family protein [Clostridia bacterium]|nr:class II aldolase/adducin family protein [Clostridia bacterium]